MNLMAVSMRNLRQRLLATILTTLSIAVGTGLIASLWLVMSETDRRYKQSYAGYKAIVGPKESAPMALVLNTVFNLSQSPGFVPMSVYQELHGGALGKRIGVRYAIPQARGDSYSIYNFPIIGTTDEMFTKFRRGKDADGQPRLLQFAQGTPFSFSHEDFLHFAQELVEEHDHDEGQEKDQEKGHDKDHDHQGEHGDEGDPKTAVIGAEVVKLLGIGLGHVIVPAHGKRVEGTEVHEHEEAGCEVIGILEPTGTPLDRSIFIPMSIFLGIAGHDALREGQAADAGNIGLSAIIVDTYSPIRAARLRYEFQTRNDAQVAEPATQVRELLQLVGSATDILRVISYLVLVVAAVSIMVALYNTMNERRREIAIMRSLGARRAQILFVILQEALLVSLLGAVLGVVFCHGAAYTFTGSVAERTGVTIDWAAFSTAEIWLILGVGALGAVAGILPAVKGSMTEVADNLGLTS